MRSNLAGVVLRMLSLKLGPVESFPFVDPPSTRLIRQGFQDLQDLGAVDEQNQLTRLGQEMARLPIDPRTARMLLEAEKQQALHEILVIAGGISIQDPREYPEEQKEKSRQIHASFSNKDSDFITLLNLWNAYHEEWENLASERKMRKFCKERFLSFPRMREWRDLYQQLRSILEEVRQIQLNEQPANNEAIHMSILSGYLSGIAQKQETQEYKGAGGKSLVIFPGSGVYKNGREWIVAAEMVETSRLFARTVANIDVKWLEPLGGPLCKHSYSDGRFDPESGRVLATEKVTLYGLTIVPRRNVSYGKVNPAEATAIFIRQGLVEEQLQSNHEFYRHNQALKHQLLSQGAKIRKNLEYDLEQAQEQFYQQRLYNIFSIHDLNRLIKQKRHAGETDFLFMKEDDMLPVLDASAEAFPDAWNLGGAELPLTYRMLPMQEKDGATLKIEEQLLPHIQPHMLEWLIPGQWEEKILYLLKALPKALRKLFVPIPQTAKTLAENMSPTAQTFAEALSQQIHKLYRVQIDPAEWDMSRLPVHLQLRIEILNDRQQVIAEGRNIVGMLDQHRKEREQFWSDSNRRESLGIWQQALKEWEIPMLGTWSFEQLPKQIELGIFQGIPLYAYPGLLENEQGIHRTLFHEQEDARQSTIPALGSLLLKDLGKDLAWMEKDLNDLKSLSSLYAMFGSFSQLKEYARFSIRQHVTDSNWIENRQQYEIRKQQAFQKLKSISTDFSPRLEQLLRQGQETRQIVYAHLKQLQTTGAGQDLLNHFEALMPVDFLKTVPYSRWPRMIQYLRAIKIRLERMSFNATKDAEKYQQWHPWKTRYEEIKAQSLSSAQTTALEEFRWLLEEFRITLFAPEIKTHAPISPKRLQIYCDMHFKTSGKP
ncbi:MAG: DUF3418 domain-containing protein [SAR324 cluster bacterium]|nr:DUF3418 domain-containing protein [SAR324 cluster bacterium]